MFSRGYVWSPGIYPYQRKVRTRNKSIWNAAMPGVAVVPFLQHAGSPAAPLVRPGDRVREGMLIGRASGPLSAQVHSPIPGIVHDLRTIQLPGGVTSLAAVIYLDGEFDRLGKTPKLFPWEHLSNAELLSQISDRGVVGMGGLGMPTHLKYVMPDGRSPEWFVMNGLESEPYLSADHRIMVERPTELMEGLRIVRKLLSASRIAIIIDRRQRDAISALRDALAGSDVECRIFATSGRYPQGDEKQIVRTVAGRDVPSGRRAGDAGVIVSNVSTILSVYEAIVLQKPVVERIVTVAGRAIRNPGNLKVRIGTPIAELIEECGGLVADPVRIVIGGPMMGLAISNVSTPVTKITCGVLALTADEIGDAPQTPCIQCGRCVRACPMGLEPTRLYRLIDHRQYEEAMKVGLLDCSECGACGYVCPAHIPLVEQLKTGKHRVMSLQQEREGRR